MNKSKRRQSLYSGVNWRQSDEDRGRQLEDLHELQMQIADLAPLVCAGRAPLVQLQCPHGHDLAAAQMVLGIGNRAWVTFPEGSRDVVRPADGRVVRPGDEETPGVMRFKLCCPECRYEGVLRQERLMKLYTVAVRLNMTAMCVPR